MELRYELKAAIAFTKLDGSPGGLLLLYLRYLCKCTLGKVQLMPGKYLYYMNVVPSTVYIANIYRYMHCTCGLGFRRARYRDIAPPANR